VPVSFDVNQQQIRTASSARPLLPLAQRVVAAPVLRAQIAATRARFFFCCAPSAPWRAPVFELPRLDGAERQTALRKHASARRLRQSLAISRVSFITGNARCQAGGSACCGGRHKARDAAAQKQPAVALPYLGHRHKSSFFNQPNHNRKHSGASANVPTRESNLKRRPPGRAAASRKLSWPSINFTSCRSRGPRACRQLHPGVRRKMPPARRSKRLRRHLDLCETAGFFGPPQTIRLSAPV